MLQKVRRILAAIFFVLLTLMLLDFTGVLYKLLGWMAKVQFLPAVLALNVVVIAALLLLTLIFGRIYCSVICPLGVFQDLVSRLHGKTKKNRFTYSKAKNWLRYPMLLLFVVALALGIGGIVSLLSPYGTYGSMMQNLLQPLYIWCNNALENVVASWGSYALYDREVWIKSLPVFLTTIALTLAIVLLAWRGGRTYCNTICPVGTVLGFVARFSWLKVHFVADKCKNCSLCTKNCKASCIDYKQQTVDYSRCVACGNCISKCQFGALAYAHPPKANKAKNTPAEGADTTRRAILTGAAIVGAEVALAQVKKVDGGMTVIADRITPDRRVFPTPPGSLSVENMRRRCVGCQLCISKCPNQVLRPSSSLERFMQPEMNFDKGFCRPDCHRCSKVCPSGAIQPISKADKSSTQIGHAVWRKSYCVVLTDGVDCGNCARHCPAGAIQMVPSNPNDDTSPEIPVVNTEKCIGCGSCEYVCPARPHAAIYVEGNEVHKTI